MQRFLCCVFLLVCVFLSGSLASADVITDYANWTMPGYFEKPVSMQVDYQGGSVAWMNSAASMLAAKGYAGGDAASVYSVLDTNQGSFATADKYGAIDWYLNTYQPSTDHAVTKLAFDSVGGITMTGGGGFINQIDIDVDVWWDSFTFVLADCSQFSFDLFGVSGTITENWLLWGWIQTTEWSAAGYHFDTDPSAADDCRLIDGFVKGSEGITDIDTLALVDNGHGGLCLEHQTPGLWTDYLIVDYSTESFWFAFAGQEVTHFDVVIVSDLVYDGNVCPEPCSLWGLAVLGLGLCGLLVRRRRK